MTIQDWGVTYEELEPHYDRFEYLCGTSGTAGNLAGPDPAGRQSLRRPALASLSEARAAAALQPRAVRARRRASSATSPFRSPRATCRRRTPIRWACAWVLAPTAGSASGSAAATIPRRVPQTTLLPVLVRKPNFEARDLCEVTRINTDSTGKRATGVTFVDASGNEFEQPADLVILERIHDLQRAAAAAVGYRRAVRSRRPTRA